MDLSTATPAEAANLQALVEGGKPPWVWVEPYAQVTNLLSPGQSVLAAGTWSGAGFVEGGAVLSADGVFSPRSVLHPTGGTVDFGYRSGAMDRPAVVPDQIVRFSAYLRGTGTLRVSFRDWAGQILKETQASYSSTTLARASVASLPPAGAVSCRVWVTGALQAALPAFTWTADLAAWSVGRGCNRVSVDGLSEAVQLAVADSPALRRSAITFTIREVG
ncbi:hypothetical protein PTW37_10250 [Arthrobacter agilis]|uniref:hypothetical protein n=1 Tax=Arthrobacter agilis TaxID=37921 RepID=UPI002365A31D|nr:hypothetical protein [Arthrobacter agilis]WDF32255.1 hypothetical protein PTW37_10250 [Arthrobacter agilis]